MKGISFDHHVWNNAKNYSALFIGCQAQNPVPFPPAYGQAGVGGGIDGGGNGNSLTPRHHDLMPRGSVPRYYSGLSLEHCRKA